MISTQYC